MSKTQGSIQTIKRLGENFRFVCPSDSCTITAGEIYNFTKLNDSTKELELIHQGRDFSKTITEYSDAGVYCCTAQCASNVEPCCHHITGMVKVQCLEVVYRSLEKFTDGYFHVKFVRGKIFSSLGVSNE